MGFIKIVLIVVLVLLLIGFIAGAVVRAKAAVENLKEIKDNLKKKKEEE